MALNEFALIRRFFNDAALNFAAPGVDLGPGDDAALLSVPGDRQLVMSVDTLNESVHFPADADPFLLGQRCLLVNLSDLSAMGADPLAFTLAISLAQVDETWLQAFSAGLAQVAQTANCPLIGGDTTRGPLSVTIQVLGTVPQGQALLRSGAAPGDHIFVTGTLGNAALALWQLLGDPRLDSRSVSAEDSKALLQAFYQPPLRLAFAQAVRNLASAALDISDGLASDLKHILAASAGNSGVSLGAELLVSNIPLSGLFQRYVPVAEQLNLALSGGDDYELCLCVPGRNIARFEQIAQLLQVQVTDIGKVTLGSGVFLLENNGHRTHLNVHGYQHFG